MNESYSEPVKAGQLQRLQRSQSSSLGSVDIQALLLELWQRLQRGDSVTSNSVSIMASDAIAEVLSNAADVHENRFSRTRYRDLHWMLHYGIKPPRPPLQGVAALDLGCGSVNPLGFGMLLCAMGASECTCVDLDEVQDNARAMRGLARLVDWLLQDPRSILHDDPITRADIEKNLVGFDIAALRRGDPAGLGSRLRHRRESAGALSLASGSIGYATSNSFLEHVDDIHGVLGELARVTRVGGYGVHSIDGKDHESYSATPCGPLDFLRSPAGKMVNGSNRIRIHEFPVLFEQHGFVVQELIPEHRTTLTDREVAAFAEPWRSMPRESLEVLTGRIVVRRV